MSACGTTASGTASTYYVITDTTASVTATGRVSAAFSPAGLSTTNCGYLMTITAKADIIVEFDTDSAYSLTALFSILLLSIMMF